MQRISSRKLVVHAIKQIFFVALVMKYRKLGRIEKAPRLQAGGGNEVSPLLAAISQIESQVREYLASMSAGDENNMVEYKTLEGAPVAYPWWQTAFQVTNHSSYHRGQIISMMRQLGLKGIGTDMIMYFKLRNACGTD